MLTQAELSELLANVNTTGVASLVVSLQKRNPIVPEWSYLQKQYEPLLHAIMTDVVKYPPLKVRGKPELKRICYGLQKVAVRRWSQALFSTPVKRNYVYDRKNTAQADAVQLIEDLLKTRCKIDKINTERAKKLGKSCQFATVWHTYPKPTIIGEDISQFKLRASVYAEDEGYSLYPIYDENKELVCLSISWTTDTGVARMTTFTNMETSFQYEFTKKGGDWQIMEGFPKKLEVFPCVYMAIDTPAWGGDEGTLLVEAIEAAESYQSTYIKRNSVPTFTLDVGEKAAGAQQSKTQEADDDSRGIVRVGKGGALKDVTWNNAGAAFEAQIARFRAAFFEQNQIPDTSFANMIKSNTSVENKDLIFADSRASAEDDAGEFESMMFDEFEIVKTLAGIMFPAHADALSKISARSVITPYNVRTLLETAELIATAPNAMSLETQVRLLGMVDDVEAETAAIKDDQATSSQLM